MNVLLIPFGSAGDVHPFIGLGAALRRRGHVVTLATNEHFGPAVRRESLDFVPLGSEEEYREVIKDPDLWHPTRAFRLVADGVIRMLRPTYELVAERYVAGETVVVTSMLGLGARIAHDHLGVPLATVHLQPGVFRSVHEAPAFPGLAMPDWWPKPLKRFMYWLMDAAFIDPPLVPGINAFRAELGLPPIRRVFDAFIHAPQLVLGLFPDWFARLQPDWPAQTVLTGFPLYDEAQLGEADPALDACLDAGPPPIVFTPGSAMAHGQAFFEAAVGACRKLNRRGLLLTRFRDHLPPDWPADLVHHFDYIPFSRVLPRSAALVHHGGIGTTAQALAAGIPQLVMPLAHDQFDNAARLRRLGVGRRLLPKHFRANAVAENLTLLLDSESTSQKGRQLAERIRDARPLDTACDAIERLLPAARRATPPDATI